jgi:TolB-like protein
VVTVHGVAVHEGRVGLWMELVRGSTLEQLLAERGPFGPREAARVGVELCRGLAAVHAAGLVHRDVKAQNVMREDGGRVVLMDLGTGRDVAAAPDEMSRLAGTPLYLAPELFDGATADVTTDIYSVGVLLYRLVTSSFPVRGASLQELQAAHDDRLGVHLRDARPELPAAFVRVVDRAISVNPADRYRSAGELESALLGSLQEEGSDTTVRPIPAPAPPRRWVRWTLGAAVAAALAAVAVMLGPSLRPPVPPPAVAAIRSIAVLPLVNLSGDQSQEYFADGLTDELIATLGKLRGLKVISRTSVAQFKGSTRSLPDIARQLGVDAVLEGTLKVTPPAAQGDQSQQPRVRVNARLILAGTDTQLWAHTFERVLTDVLALQSELAEAVAEEMNVNLTGEQRSALAGQGSRNAQAQQAYLEGRSHLVYASRDRQMKARDALERAVRLDPNFARAHASLSVSYVTLELLGLLSGPDADRLAKASATRALQLDDTLAEAHLVMADMQMLHDWRWSDAQSSYLRALALNPSYTFARRNYAWCLAALGRGKEALDQAQLGETADPLSPDARAAVAMMLYFNRQYDGAIAQM